MRGVFKKNVCLLAMLVLFQSFLIAQDPKPPVAEDDYATTFMAASVSINVLANDYSYDGDSLVIYAITAVSHGEAFFEDSLIHYQPGTSNSLNAEASVYYMVKDLTTGLWSNEAEVKITLERPKNIIFNPNKLSARINALGNQFLALDSFTPEEPRHHFEAPANSGKHTIYNSALWIAGLDNNGFIHTACERFRNGKLPFLSNRGWDFWVGPVVDPENYTDQYLNDYNQIWEISREDINYHNNNYSSSNYTMPQTIKNWPAEGYPELGGAEKLAPFVDRNQNNIYDPENGDYPLVHGDEAIYFIFNDDFGNHTESFGRKLGIEVHGMAYGFNCDEDSTFSNTIFIRYDIINRSDTVYHDVYLGNYTNLAIGGGDDYLACDTLLNAYYAYNMDDYDDTLSPYYPGYLEHPPAQALVWLNQPIHHFMYCQFPWPYTDTMFNLAPYTPERYYNFMKSVWNDSTHLTFGGDGHLGTDEVDHAFTGDPISAEGWLEQNSGLEDAKLQGIGSVGPLQFNPGDTLSHEVAYVFARDNEGDHLSSVSLLKQRIERVKWYYDNDSTPCSTPWTGTIKTVKNKLNFNVYPNPANNHISVEFDQNEKADAVIYDYTGKILWRGKFQEKFNLDISFLEKGFYLIECRTKSLVLTKKFFKI